jgi:hypothetical protein
MILKRNDMLYGDVGTDISVVRWSQFVNKLPSESKFDWQVQCQIEVKEFDFFKGGS